MAVRSTLPGSIRDAPRTKPALDALSAMVSMILMFQLSMRESISSMDAVTWSVQARTSSSVQPSPGRVRPRTKATSISTRGMQ